MSDLKSCKICQNSAKYKCPQCLTQTCSLQCSRQHKAQCGNNSNQPAYIPLSHMDSELLLADCKLLDRIARSLESTSRAYTKPLGLIASKRIHVRVLQRCCSERGIELHLCPANLRRFRINRTVVRAGRILWSVEWRFGNQDFAVVVHRMNEHQTMRQHLTTLLASLSMSNRSKSIARYFANFETLAILLKNFNCKATPAEFFKCNLDETLRSTLANTKVVDFPHFIVLLEDELEGFKLVDKIRDTQEAGPQASSKTGSTRVKV